MVNRHSLDNYKDLQVAESAASFRKFIRDIDESLVVLGRPSLIVSLLPVVGPIGQHGQVGAKISLS